MVDPLSVVALSLTCLNGCVKALVIIGKARHYSQDVSDVQFRTHLILHSLATWAQEAGLTREPPVLLVSANDAPFVPKILGQLESLFTDINELRVRYGSSLQQTDEEIDGIDDEAGKLLDAAASRCKWSERLDITVYLKRKQPWNRLRWVTLDEEKFDRLLAKAKNYVGELGKFLEQAKRESMEHQLEFWLRSTILKADGRRLGILGRVYQEPESSTAISAAAKIKEARLLLGISESLPDKPVTSIVSSSDTRRSSSPHRANVPKQRSLEHMRLSMRLLHLGKAAVSRRLRTLAQYDGRTVLLEWKYVADMDDPAISGRVSQVAALLHSVDPTLHSLRCRGFVKDRVAKRYGYIFDLPDELNSTSRRSHSTEESLRPHPRLITELKSLRELLDEQRKPSLNVRLSLAVTLLETLLNLHTSGWLHKELRSDNIILVRRIEESAEDDTNNVSQYSAYVAGYVYSRLDKPGEMTEPLRSEFEADLYRHPDLLSDTHQPYRKAFDIFSVGCTLLEIGLWTNLRRILEQHSRSCLESKLPTTAERTKPELSLGGNTKLQVAESDTSVVLNKKKSLDFMALRHQLVNFHTSDQGSGFDGARTSTSVLTNCVQSDVMDSLQSATGERFAGIVKELLVTSKTADVEFADEHESALDLEMMARDVVRAVAEAV